LKNILQTKFGPCFIGLQNFSLHADETKDVDSTWEESSEEDI